ncbi:DUF3606 domain-containing protein [Brevundimonas sp. FT23042]|uniref:DUF3606 domain-containing protein n=1 Tax=Brevundimonas sp. FT23042 TaxID=3393749 RepID=UPI003B588662
MSASSLPGAAAFQTIRLDDPADVRRWTAIYGVTEAALRRAVARVGPLPEAVQRELGGRR